MNDRPSVNDLFGRFVLHVEPGPGNPNFGRTDKTDPARVLGSYRDTSYGEERLRLAAERLGMTRGEYIRRAVRLAFQRDLEHVLRIENEGGSTS